MANLLLKGLQEWIDITNSEAERLNQILADNSIPKDQVINLKNVTFRKAEIKLVKNDIQQNNDYDNLSLNYHNEQFALMKLEPNEKALRCWGHFILFYFGVFNKDPDVNFKELLFEKAISFFEENKDRTIPDMKVYIDFLELSNDFRMEGNILRILERVESNQLRLIREKQNKIDKENNINSYLDEKENDFKNIF